MCWGDNELGQLGDGTTTDRALAADVPGLTDVAQIAAGFLHTCALVRGGSLKCWGYNTKGAVGDGTTEGPRTKPTDVVGLPHNVTAVAPGREHTCALVDNNVWCWGDNAFGQIGDGKPARVQPSPVEVVGLTGNVTSIGSGWYHTCALTEAREVECWGNNASGQLGNGQQEISRVDAPVMVQGLPSDIVALVVGGGHNCVLTASHRVTCWGANNYGQLGDGTTTNRATPVDVAGLPADVVTIAAGTGQTCALLAAGGMKCWGHDWYGELGDGTTGEGNVHPQPVDVQGLPSGVTALTMGRFHTCVLADNGAVQCWGRNGFGDVGDSTRAQRLTPVGVLVAPH
jgi:alpha-tubulin suppressor-like RCC1 family protein